MRLAVLGFEHHSLLVKRGDFGVEVPNLSGLAIRRCDGKHFVAFAEFDFAQLHLRCVLKTKAVCMQVAWVLPLLPRAFLASIPTGVTVSVVGRLRLKVSCRVPRAWRTGPCLLTSSPIALGAFTPDEHAGHVSNIGFDCVNEPMPPVSTGLPAPRCGACWHGLN